jgi:type I restriction enzyme S subunit
MKVYPKYKSSGVIWVKQLPEDWSELRVKYFAIFRNGYSFKGTDFFENQEYPVVRIGDLENGRINLENTMKVSSKIYEETKKFVNKKGDILLALTGATIGKSAIYDTNKISLLNQRVAALRPNKKADIKFLKYLIESPEFLTFIDFECYGGAQENIGKGQITSAKFPIPSLAEQQKIVDFLDYKTGQCNRFIANRQKQIELLNEQKAAIINKAVTKGINPNVKMKASGIEWIGDIPENWKVSKVKFVANVKGRIGFRGYTVNDLVDEGKGALTLGATQINKEGEIDLAKSVFISWDKYYESPEIMVQESDILVVQRGSTIGTTGIVGSNIGCATINPSLTILKRVKMNRYLLFLQLRSKIVKEAITTIFNETAIPMLSQNQISNFNILLPSNEEEQQSIIDFIKKETSTIEALISKYQKQIDLMQEYRTALISQAVTGNIDVRDWQLPHN